MKFFITLLSLFYFVFSSTTILASFVSDQIFTKAQKALFDKEKKLIYLLLENNEILKFSPNLKQISPRIRLDIKDKIIAATNHKEFLIIITKENNSKEIKISLINKENGRIIKSKNVLPPSDLETVKVLDKEHIALVFKQNLSLIILNLKTFDSKKINESISGILYAKPQIDSDSKKIYLPGAYPGEIVSINFLEKSPDKTVSIYEIDDWIHDVKKISDNTFLTCGHLFGLSVINTKNKTTKIIYENNSTSTKLFTFENYAAVIDQNQIKIIDLKSMKIIKSLKFRKKTENHINLIEPTPEILAYENNNFILFHEYNESLSRIKFTL